MNDYYLIALNEDEPKVIRISTEYLDYNKFDQYVSHAKIAYIDFLMSKYNLNDVKKSLFKGKKIDSLDTRLLIFHRHKFNDKYHLKHFELITKDNTTEEFEEITKKAFYNEEITVSDCEKTIKTFFNKYRNKEFKAMVDWIYTDLNEHKLSNLYHTYSKLFDAKKKESALKQIVDYVTIRKLMSLINLSKRFNTCDDYIDYLSSINVYKKKHLQKLVEITDSQMIYGQLNMFDEMKFENTKEENYLDEYVKLKDEILNTPWDDEYIKECFLKNIFPENFNQIMTLEDKVRAGLIDIVDYMKLKEESKNKGYK